MAHFSLDYLPHAKEREVTLAQTVSQGGRVTVGAHEGTLVQATVRVGWVPFVGLHGPTIQPLPSLRANPHV